MTLTKWDQRWLTHAKTVSEWSKDPSTRVGAVLARDKQLIAMGYNGFPRSIQDIQENYENRDYKYKRIIHAEANVLKQVTPKDCAGATLYTFPFQPCSVCALQVVNYGVKRVISTQPPQDKLERWAEDFELTKELFEEAGVKLIIAE